MLRGALARTVGPKGGAWRFPSRFVSFRGDDGVAVSDDNLYLAMLVWRVLITLS